MISRGQIYVFSGPSGAGKSTLTRKLKDRVEGLAYSVSHTSRVPRKNEVEGIDYHFVEIETFKRMAEEKAFVEWALVYNDLYGTSFASLNDQIAKGLDVILDIDSQGAKNIKKNYEDSILIYILPPSLEVLEKRLRSRATDDDRALEKRIRSVHDELVNCEWYDYLIINDDLEEAYREAESIILSGRCRKTRALPEVKKIFNI